MILLYFRITVKNEAIRNYIGPSCIILRVILPKGGVSFPCLVIKTLSIHSKCMQELKKKLAYNQSLNQRNKDVSISKVCITTTYVGIFHLQV